MFGLSKVQRYCLARKWQKNLEKQGATGAGNAIENRGSTNPSSVGV